MEGHRCCSGRIAAAVEGHRCCSGGSSLLQWRVIDAAVEGIDAAVRGRMEWFCYCSGKERRCFIDAAVRRIGEGFYAAVRGSRLGSNAAVRCAICA